MCILYFFLYTYITLEQKNFLFLRSSYFFCCCTNKTETQTDKAHSLNLILLLLFYLFAFGSLSFIFFVKQPEITLHTYINTLTNNIRTAINKIFKLNLAKPFSFYSFFYLITGFIKISSIQQIDKLSLNNQTRN